MGAYVDILVPRLLEPCGRLLADARRAGDRGRQAGTVRSQVTAYLVRGRR